MFIAFDKESIRSKDVDGHLHVESTPISKAVVNPYLGSEIPGGSDMGLQPDKIYKLLRHPAELKRAAETFDGKPLQIVHKANTAGDHDKVVVVGSVHNPKFDHPYLKADLAVWDGDAIAGIENGDQRELSCGYRYRPDMTPGVYEGESYDGVMRDLVGNHVALVEKGRAGPDVMVGDAALKGLGKVKQKTVLKRAADSAKAVADQLRADLANDAALGPVVAMYDKMAADAAKACDETPDDEEAMDAPLDISGMKAEDAEEEEEVAKKKAADKRARDKKAMDKAAKDKAAKDAMEEKERAAADAEEKEEKDKKAMDAAIEKAVNARVSAERANDRAIREALDDARKYVGDMHIAADNAVGVYQSALGVLGIRTKVDNVEALRLVLHNQPKPGAVSARPLAMDSASTAAITAKIPGLARFLPN